MQGPKFCPLRVFAFTTVHFKVLLTYGAEFFVQQNRLVICQQIMGIFPLTSKFRLRKQRGVEDQSLWAFETLFHIINSCLSFITYMSFPFDGGGVPFVQLWFGVLNNSL